MGSISGSDGSMASLMGSHLVVHPFTDKEGGAWAGLSML